MSLTEDLRKGMVIRHEGQLFAIVDYHIAQSGKQRPTVHVKLRSIGTGHTGDRTLDQLGRLTEVPSDMRTMQYLYAGHNEWVFMDTESFEQYSFDGALLGSSVDFLLEEEPYRFLFLEGQPVSIQMPEVAVLEVVDTAPVEHAGGSTNVHKDAKLSSGITIAVPLFIKNGDRIRVKFDSHEYVGKEH